jgi:hypothetical protein
MKGDLGVKRLNFTGVDGAAGAFAAVLTALVSTATLFLQWRSAKLADLAAAHGVPVSPSGTQSPEPPLAANEETGITTDGASELPGDDVSLKPPAERWLTPKKIVLPPLSGIAAGLIVILVAAWITGNQHPSVHINSPRYGTAVPQLSGFQASGMSSDLGNDTIWLADYDGSGYYVDSEATIKVGGSWTAPDSQLGNPKQTLPFPLTARVIIADAQCADALQGAINSNKYYLPSLPGGCEIAGAITVEVTRR